MKNFEGGDYSVKLSALAQNTFLRWRKYPSKSVVEEALNASQNGVENAMVTVLALDMRIVDRYSGFLGVLCHPFAYRREIAVRRRIGKLISKFGGAQTAILAQGENAQSSGGGSGENGGKGEAKSQEDKAKQRVDKTPAEENEGERTEKNQKKPSERKDKKAVNKEQGIKEGKKQTRLNKGGEKTLKENPSPKGVGGDKTAEKERRVAKNESKTEIKASAPKNALKDDGGAKKPNKKGEKGDTLAEKKNADKTAEREKPVQKSNAPKAGEKTAVFKNPDEIYFGDIPEILGLDEPAKEREKTYMDLPHVENFNEDSVSIQSPSSIDLAAGKDVGMAGQNGNPPSLDENAERIRLREVFENMDEKDLNEIKNAMERSLEEQSAKAVAEGDISRMNISVKEAFEHIIHSEKSSAVDSSNQQPPQINGNKN
ncbi:MAG: hypothetical protein ACI4QN_03345 [Candidatus Coproplasma sp.]